MGIKHNFIILAVGLLSLSAVGSLSSCSTNDDGGGAQIIDEKPSPGEKTQFYLKNNFDNLSVGMTLNLEEYIEVIPGKNEDSSATQFKSLVLTGETTTSAGYIVGGNGTSNKLTLSSVGKVILKVTANNESKTFVLNVGLSRDLTNISSKLQTISDNYTLEKIYTDENYKQETIGKAIRGTNYFYDETNKSGIILSKLDDEIYEFNLESSSSSNLDVQVPPVAQKDSYNTLFVNLSNFADPTLWQYSELFNNNALLKKYTLYFSGSTLQNRQFFSSLYYLGASFTISNTTFYPHAVFASYVNDTLSFLPLVVSSDGSTLSYFPEVVLSNVGSSKVEVLDNYVQDYLAPEKTDVSEVISAYNYLNEIFDYSVFTKTSIYDEDGKKVNMTDPVVDKYMSNLIWNPY